MYCKSNWLIKRIKQRERQGSLSIRSYLSFRSPSNTFVNHEIGSLADKNQTISDSSIQIATAAEEQGVVADNIASSVE